MKFKVDDIIYFGYLHSSKPQQHWKILSLSEDGRVADIQLVKCLPYDILGRRVLRWTLQQAHLVEKIQRHHPLTTIFKD